MGTYQKVIDKNLDAKKAEQHRQELIKKIEAATERRLLVYVADIKKPQSSLTLEDKTGFSDLIDGVEVDGVDVLVNSPGGFAEVAESIVEMLRAKYKSIRFLVPNAAKSAATLMVLSGDEILMDHRSELGPIDPQVQYTTKDGLKQEAAEAIIVGFEAAKEALSKSDPAAIRAYVPLLEKYTIGLLQGCQNAIELSKTLAETWLRTYMFDGDEKAKEPTNAAAYLGSHKLTLSHSRPITIDKCKKLNLKIVDLREAKYRDLQQLLWELWCMYELHFERTPITKVYENSSGTLLQKVQAQIIVQQVNPGLPQIPQIPIPKQTPPGPLPGLPGGGGLRPKKT
ncbi:MAG TPA: hypothetical protein VMF11_08385 [Candidatus Baltobacteraceae bacterium]|nr:hypothetical protein [Candidatus Baltobacteraceae bacterium]